MVALSVNQHELLADDAASGLLFGTEGTNYLTITHPTKEPGDVGGIDFARNREDGVTFGEEYEGPASVTFEVGVLTDTGVDVEDLHDANSDALDLFESTWRSRRWRVPHDAYAVLRSNMAGGRTRRCYGRPRRFAATEDGLAKKGYSTFLCDFSVMDGRWYDDVAKTAATPAILFDGQQRQVAIDVGGTQDAWPVATLTPGTANLVNPTIVIGPLSITLLGTIAPGSSIGIDPRPWRRQFVINGNPNLPPTGINPVGGSTLLRDFHLPPGSHMVTLTADSLAANARATVEWRDAWSRW